MQPQTFSFTGAEQALRAADQVYAVDMTALNNSGVEAKAFVAKEGDKLTVATVADDVTPEQVHIQHIHGRFDAEGNPADSVSPTIADDADNDGFVEVAEGVPAYGDILLPIEDQSDGFNNGPVANADGEVRFLGTFDLTDDSQFLNPLSGTQYQGEDLLPLELREVVIHGLLLPDGTSFGAGTSGEVDGTPGYKVALPVASGELEEMSAMEALNLLSQARGGVIAEGDGAEARSTGSIAVGNGAVAEGQDALAIGDAASATGASTTAVGGESIANGTAATAFGWQSNAEGERAHAFGHIADASGDFSLAVGEAASAGYANSVAIGSNATASADNDFALGNASHSYTLAGLGHDGASPQAVMVDADGLLAALAWGGAASGGDGSDMAPDSDMNGAETGDADMAADGSAATSSDDVMPESAPIMVGDGATMANGIGAIAIGNVARADGRDAIAIGDAATADGNSTTAVGGESTADGTAATAFGWKSNAEGERAHAFGHIADASGDFALAVGEAASAGYAYSVAIGSNAAASADYDVALGNADHHYTLAGLAAIVEPGQHEFLAVDGEGQLTTAAFSDLFAETTDMSGTADPDDQAANGSGDMAADDMSEEDADGATSDDSAITLGDNAVGASEGAIAIGNNAVANGQDAVAIGDEASANGTSTTAVGGESSADGTAATAFGWQYNAEGERAHAFGHIADASGDFSLAVGEAASAGYANSVAIGSNVTASSENDFALGTAENNYTLAGLAADGDSGIVTVDDTGRLDQVNLVMAGDGGELLRGTAGADVILGGAGNDTISARVGADKVASGDGNDRVFTNGGNDMILGGAGDDFLDAGAGSDQIWSESGNDRIALRTGFEEVRVYDFEDGMDRFDMSRNDAVSGFDSLSVSQNGADVLIEDGAGNRLFLVGTDVATIDSGDFLF